MSRRGVVWSARRRVGTLRELGGRMHLAYDPAWVSGGGYPVSLQLPLAAADHERDAHEFFAGLLPEARARERAQREHRVREDDDFGLLLAIGRDCAGSLSVLPEGERPGSAPAPVPIDADALAALVQSRGRSLPEGTESQRFSLAGAQDKVAVRLENGRWWLPDQDRPSTHILKFETLKQVCLAEYLARDLGGRAGLDIASTRFERDAEGTPYLVFERFDRAVDQAGQRLRLHQEDVAQALGVPPFLKYEEHGGPALAHVVQLVRTQTADPLRDVTRLRDWQLFNYLVGNYDGHSKNLALVYPAGKSVPVLAPFYDIVSLEFLYRIGVRFARRLAYSVNGKVTPEEIGREDWTAFAVELGMARRPLLQRLRELAETLTPLAETTRAEFARELGDNQVLDRFVEVIRDRCKWTLGVLG